MTNLHEIEGFSSGSPALDGWLRRRALENQASGSARTWVVTDGDAGPVVAYYASATASILRSVTSGRIARNQPDEIPAVLLARMAVDLHHQGRGLGAALLKHMLLKAWEVSSLVGARIVLVHAKDPEARSFYEHFGFVESPVDSLTMMQLISNLNRPSAGR